jgi:N6-L-threonylcarbamoyladenine synthase
MIILSIETSCDDTGVAILKTEKKKLRVLSNVISSQVKLHAKYGGVYPSLAKREHQKNLPAVFKKALKEAGSPKIDAIAVTIGPGLEPCLWTGVNFAKDLAEKMKLQIIPINHIEGHILTNFINKTVAFPAMCLVVSGGHTQIILMSGFGKYEILGETRDDAAGECFDKTARILGLGYPGGPIVADEAAKAKSRKFKINLPRPMMKQNNYDFSFSGLKTAVLYDSKNRSKKESQSKEYIQEMCAEIQNTVIDVLISKTLKAARDFKVKTLILAGGVSANEELRERFKKELKTKNYRLNFMAPEKNLCTDNAVMVAVAASFNVKNKRSWKEIEANANLRIDERI